MNPLGNVLLPVRTEHRQAGILPQSNRRLPAIRGAKHGHIMILRNRQPILPRQPDAGFPFEGRAGFPVAAHHQKLVVTVLI